LLVDVFGFFSLFVGFVSLNLCLFFLLLLLGKLGHLLLVLLFLLLDVLLDFGRVVFFLLLILFGKGLDGFCWDGRVHSSASFGELHWVLVVGYILSIIIVVESAVNLYIFIATLILFLSIDFFHLFVLRLLISQDLVRFVIKVGSPFLGICTTLSDVGISLNKIEIALFSWHGSGAISFI